MHDVQAEGGVRGVQARDELERGELERLGARGEEGAVGGRVACRRWVRVRVELGVEAEDGRFGSSLYVECRFLYGTMSMIGRTSSSVIASSKSDSFTQGNSCGRMRVEALRELLWAYVDAALDEEALEAFYAGINEGAEVRLSYCCH